MCLTTTIVTFLRIIASQNLSTSRKLRWPNGTGTFCKHKFRSVEFRAKMAANQKFWTDAFYKEITASEDAAINFLRERNLLRSLQNPPGIEKISLTETFL